MLFGFLYEWTRLLSIKRVMWQIFRLPYFTLEKLILWSCKFISRIWWRKIRIIRNLKWNTEIEKEGKLRWGAFEFNNSKSRYNHRIQKY